MTATRRPIALALAAIGASLALWLGSLADAIVRPSADAVSEVKR